jgi:hypothetical protein
MAKQTLARVRYSRMAWMSLPLRATFSSAHPLADIFHPPHPPIAAQSISQGRTISPSEGLQIFPTLPSGEARVA